MKVLLLGFWLVTFATIVIQAEASRNLLSTTTTTTTRQLKKHNKDKGNSKYKSPPNTGSALRDPATDLYARWRSAAANTANKKKNRRRPPPRKRNPWKPNNKSPSARLSPKPIRRPPPKKFPASPKPSPSPRDPMPSPMSSPRPPPSFTPSPPNNENTDGVLSGAQRTRVEALTNIFEFSNTQPQYAQSENLGDGRGITFGSGGFCTGTGDGLAVIEEYVKRSPGTSGGLAVYLPALRAINAARVGESNPSVIGLLGFEAAVLTAATTDQAFRDAQDAVLKALYFTPSQAEADRLGLKLPISRGQMYDAYFQHGENDPDDDFYPSSANGMAELTSLALGGSPAQGVDELMWLSVFLSTRKQVLLASDATWVDAANRVEIYEWLLVSGVTEFDRGIILSEEVCTLVFPGVCSVTQTAVEVGPSAYGSFYIP